jgi:DNA-binding GntR family transcriptional regulator
MAIEYGVRVSISDESDPRAYVRLAARIRRDIAEGTLAPGMPTPSITTLSQQYGHARQTCAKALRVLVDEGLLARIPGLGYYVTGTPGTEPIGNRPDAPAS